MSTDPLLKVTDLTKHFPVTKGLLFEKVIGQVRAVDGISFEVGAGETLALVGESGCGKTTVTKLILKQHEPTHGSITFAGKDVPTMEGDDLRSFRTKVQAVFQDPWSSLNPRMRVRDIVSEALVVNHAASKSEIADRIEDVLKHVGLRPEQARNFPHEFSGGQRQRIAIAAALISSPDMLVLDEPVSALDVSIRSQIMNLFRDLQDEYGMSYLMVAHDLGTTRYMADTVAVMYLGKIVEIAPAKSLFDAPRNPYTQALFSAALPVNPDSVSDEIILEGEVPSPINPPSGCSFHPRCPFKVGEICEKVDPLLLRQPDNPKHMVACHRHGETGADVSEGVGAKA